jgi:hypothetical protein
MLEPKSDYIHQESKEHEVYLSWFLQSDYAQIGAVLESDVLKKLADFELRLEIDILSWGGVAD